MADLQTDLRRGGLNWVDSGGTWDPFQEGPEWAFGPYYGERYEDGPVWIPRSRIARLIQAIGSLLLIIFVVSVVFFLEPLVAIFSR